MKLSSTAGQVMPVRNLREYFRQSIDDAIDRQGVAVDGHATHYVVNLLTLFSRSEQLYEDHGDAYGLRPLALMLADAVDARSAEQRSLALQRIGDVALFISGFFADSLAHKLVDLDYYIYMGGSAYGSLSDEVRGTARGRALADVYAELAAKFQVVVDILNDVRDTTRQSSDIDLLRTYEVWLKTGSRRAAMLLKQNGVVPITGLGTRHNQ
ncbi:MAG: hypothetical protein OEW68_01175 [Gammaproteobacteria bacterium]|nr:hypothetical protein [Gammaproteobacteria bacterium]MDH4313435.1 hypothetical protein [Gammaproteobacteria bacterium]MDH5213011.1 hypothetical protein [Gammaproteobacteria bacterium]MDH5502164.1 hypothetical protein [Gammaproteobacteria bacterium]